MKGLLAAVCAAMLLAACGSAPPSSSHRPSASPVPTPTPIPPLSAPAMVQVENSTFGRPQSGLGQADLVYEYVAEGGVGRFSLFFFTLPQAAQNVGPVRSARTVTIALAQQYHAFLVFSGASTYILGLLHAAGFPHYDEDTAGPDLFRVSFRYAPHNLYSNGQSLADLAHRANLPAVGYRLWQRSEQLPAGGSPIQKATVFISDYEQPVFTWHPELHGFTRTEDTGLVTDPKSGAPVVIPTVIVQQVDVTPDPNVVDVNGTEGVDQRITGSGQAQILTGGRVYSATWQQPGDGPPTFTLANGQPAPIAPGEVWICLVATGTPAAVFPTPTPVPATPVSTP